MSQSLRQQDIQQREHTCQSEHENHGKSKTQYAKTIKRINQYH